MSEKEPDELDLEKHPLEDLPDDLPVEKEADDVQGGMAPPYVPVGPFDSES